MNHTKFLRALCLTLVSSLLFWGVVAVDAANPVRISVPAGTTVVEVANYSIQIESTDDVIVAIRVDGESVQGSVELESGTRSATVTITVLGPPDKVIFSGRVVGIQVFREYIPHETGQGEM
jgi:hypothetical protein